jgi:excisionase family DNA binding protein
MQAHACSIAEAAERAGISRSTAYEEIRRGRLRVRKIGRRSIITDEDYRRWLDELPVVEAGAAEPMQPGQRRGQRRRRTKSHSRLK